MVTPAVRFWLSVATLIQALFAFFMGVFFSVWSDTVVGLTYLTIGIILCITPFIREDALSGSMGAWMLCGLLSLCLAAFMWQERE